MSITQRLLDTAQMRTQYPDWLCREMEEAAMEILRLREQLEGATTAVQMIADLSEWHRGDDGRTHLAFRVADNADLSCQAFRRDALRAAVQIAVNGANTRYPPDPGC